MAKKHKTDSKKAERTPRQADADAAAAHDRWQQAKQAVKKAKKVLKKAAKAARKARKIAAEARRAASKAAKRAVKTVAASPIPTPAAKRKAPKKVVSRKRAATPARKQAMTPARKQTPKKQTPKKREPVVVTEPDEVQFDLGEQQNS